MTARARVDLPELPCPYDCGTSPTLGLAVDGGTGPSAGDTLVCFRCQHPAVYVSGPDGLSLRKATALEAAEYAVDQGLLVQELSNLRARGSGR